MAAELKEAFWERPAFRRTLAVCAAMAILGGGFYGYRAVERFGQQQRSARLARATLTIRLADPPAWLDRSLVDAILYQAQVFAGQSVPLRAPRTGMVSNYDRLCDSTLDRQVAVPHADALRELADYYTAHATDDSNAWIRRITSIRRVYDPQRNVQTVLIAADFRRPVALVVQGDAYYLVDEAGTRLPGTYSQRDAAAMVGHVLSGAASPSQAMMMLRGIDAAAPDPGQAFTTPDFKAGLALVGLLAGQPYAGQIGAIDLSNFGGRVSSTDAYIVLDTVYPDPAGGPGTTRIYWGRPAGDEKFFEVSASAKLAALAAIFQQYGRIDAGRPYVDIRFDQPKVPVLATTTTPARSDASPPAVGRRTRG